MKYLIVTLMITVPAISIADVQSNSDEIVAAFADYELLEEQIRNSNATTLKWLKDSKKNQDETKLTWAQFKRNWSIRINTYREATKSHCPDGSLNAKDIREKAWCDLFGYTLSVGQMLNELSRSDWILRK